MIILDTSSLVRFFTNDVPKKAQKVKKLIESDKELYIPDVVFVELEYVLLGVVYGEPRDKVLKAFKFLISKENIDTSNILDDAVILYENSKLDMADCIVSSYAKNKKIASFDKELIKLSGGDSEF